MAITKDMLIGDVVQKHPKAAEVLAEQGMHCIGCHVATWETMEQGLVSHGLDVKKTMVELNKRIKG